VCKYPLEFDKTIYLDGEEVRGITRDKYDAGSKGDDAERHFKDIVHAMDIWGEIEPLKIPNFNKNSFWFAHPVYFINHLDKAGLLDNGFNPYEGKEIFRPKEGMHLEERRQKVVDSPGFAPVTTNDTEYKYDNINYSNCSSLFNVNRQMPKKEMRHEGIDLAPSNGEKTVIKSLVFGEVWACTFIGSIKEKDDNGSYGRVMIIKNLNDNKLYFLAHLDKYLKEVNDLVYPGDDVAVCGMTGNSTGVHLHVEVRLCNEVKKDDVLDKEGNQKHKDDDPSSNGIGVKWIKGNGPLRVNPFNHKEKYEGVWL